MLRSPPTPSPTPPHSVAELWRSKSLAFCTACAHPMSLPHPISAHEDNIIYNYTWWLIPLSKWVITPVINGISRVNPLIIGVITHLLSGMNHQVYIYIYVGREQPMDLLIPSQMRSPDPERTEVSCSIYHICVFYIYVYSICMYVCIIYIMYVLYIYMCVMFFYD